MLLVVSSLMYIGACTDEVVYILQFLRDIRNLGDHSSTLVVQTDVLYYLRVAFGRTNVSMKLRNYLPTQLNFLQYLLSDGVVCWRAWVLCYNMKIAQASLILCMIGSFGK